MVEQLIAQPGHEDTIEELIVAVYNLGEISLADPENPTELRDFDIWVRAQSCITIPIRLSSFASLPLIGAWRPNSRSGWLDHPLQCRRSEGLHLPPPSRRPGPPRFAMSRHQFTRSGTQPPFALLPSILSASEFAAIEFAEAEGLWHWLDELTDYPLREVCGRGFEKGHQVFSALNAVWARLCALRVIGIT